MAALVITLIVIALLSAVAVGFAAGRLSADNRNLRRELEKLQAMQPARMPYDVMNGVEDATAVAWRIHREMELRDQLIKQNEIEKLQYAKDLERLIEILRAIRGSNGKRK